MKFKAAVVKEEDKTFAIVSVPSKLLRDKDESESARRWFHINVFKDVPVVLVTRDELGNAEYAGPVDIVAMLLKYDYEEIPFVLYEDKNKK